MHLIRIIGPGLAIWAATFTACVQAPAQRPCTTYRDSAGLLHLDCPDGTSVTWRDGTDGTDGSDCSVSDLGDGRKEIRCADGSVVEWSDGRDGTDGNDAMPCTVAALPDGSYAVSCPDSTRIVVRNGVNGTNGTPGQDGSSCTVRRNANDTVTVACTDGTSVTFPVGVVTFDGGTPDAGTPDAGTPDAGTPDAGTPGCTWSGTSPTGSGTTATLLPRVDACADLLPYLPNMPAVTVPSRHVVTPTLNNGATYTWNEASTCGNGAASSAYVDSLMGFRLDRPALAMVASRGALGTWSAIRLVKSGCGTCATCDDDGAYQDYAFLGAGTYVVKFMNEPNAQYTSTSLSFTDQEPSARTSCAAAEEVAFPIDRSELLVPAAGQESALRVLRFTLATPTRISLDADPLNDGGDLSISIRSACEDAGTERASGSGGGCFVTPSCSGFNELVPFAAWPAGTYFVRLSTTTATTYRLKVGVAP